MSTYEITGPDGRTVTLEGDTPPSEQELDQIFSSVKDTPSFDLTGNQNTTPPTTKPPVQNAVTDEQKKAGGLFASAFPKTFEAQMNDKSYLQQVGSAIGDVFSLPARAVTSAATFAGAKAGGASNQQATEMYQEDLSKRKSDMGGVPGFIEDVVEDPALIPSLAVGGPALGAGKSALVKAGKMALTGLAEGATSAAVHQAERFGETGKVNLSEAALEAGASGVAGGAFPLVGGVVKKGISQIKNAISNFAQIPIEFIERAAKKGELEKISEAFTKVNGDPEKLSDDILEMVGSLRVRAENEIKLVEEGLQSQVDLAQSKATQKMKSSILNERTGGTIENASDIVGSDVGQKIQDAAELSKSGISQKFGKWQEKIMKEYGVGDAPLKSTTNTHPLVSKINEIYSEIGYNPQVGHTGNEKIGSLAVDQKVVGAIEKIEEKIFNANTIGDAINQKRAIGSMVSSWDEGTKELFKKGTAGDLVLKRIYEKMDNEIESQIEQFGNNQLSRLWKANNAVYKVGRDALEKVQKGLGMSRPGNVDAYYTKIKNIGVSGLKELKSAVGTNKNVKPIWEELQNGFYDSLILKAMKNGDVDPVLFKQAYDTIDKNISDLMLSPKQKNNIENAFRIASEELNQSLSKSAASAETAVNTIKSKYGISKSTNEIGDKIIGKSPNADSQRVKAITTINNIGSMSADKQIALKQMEFIEELMNVPEKEKISNLIIDSYAGKKLSMTKEGTLPKYTSIRTGASLAGGVVGAGIASNADKLEERLNIPGIGVVGGLLGFTLGAYSQSPAGAVAMFKLINKFKSPTISRATNAIGTTINNKLTRQAVRTTINEMSQD